MGLFRSFSFFFEFIIIIPILVVIFVTAALRGDNDPSGNRTQALYLGVASFVTFVVLLIGAYTIVNGFTHLARANDSYSTDSPATDSYGNSYSGISGRTPSALKEHPERDSAWRTTVLGGIITGIAGGLWFVHRKRIDSLQNSDNYENSSAERSIQLYSYLQIFVAVSLILVGGIAAIYNVFQLLGPGVFLLNNRGDGFADIARNLFVVLEGVGAFILYRGSTAFKAIPKVIAPPTETAAS